MLFLHILSREECAMQMCSEKYVLIVKQILVFSQNILVSLKIHRLLKEMWLNVLGTGQKGAALGQAAAKDLCEKMASPQRNVSTCP